VAAVLVLITSDISVVLYIDADSVPRSGRFGSVFDLTVGEFLHSCINRRLQRGL